MRVMQERLVDHCFNLTDQEKLQKIIDAIEGSMPARYLTSRLA